MRLVCLILLLLGVSGAAFALPVLAVIASTIGGAAFTIGVGAAAVAVSWGTIIFTGAMLLYGQSQQRKAKQQQQAQLAQDKASYNANLKDREISGVAVEFPERMVYGTARLGVSVVAIFTSGNRDQYKHVVGVIAQHELDAIQEVYLDKKPIGALDANGEATTGDFVLLAPQSKSELLFNNTFPFTLAFTPNTNSLSIVPVFVRRSLSENNLGEGFGGNALAPSDAFTGFKVVGNQVIFDPAYTGPALQTAYAYELRYLYTATTSYVRVSKHLGALTDQVDPLLQTAVGALVWPSTSVLRGHSYIYLRLLLDKAEFQSSLPSIEVLVRGKKVLDVRTGLTVWSANPALCIRDYLISKFGAVASFDIPTSQFISAANDCDEVVSMIDGTVLGPRYTLNGVVTSDESRETVLQNMAAAMAGDIVETTWDVYAGKYYAPVMDLYQDDIVGEFAISPGNPELAVFNTVKGAFVSAENKYIPTDYKPYVNLAYRAEDGEPLENTLDFPFTNTQQRATNLARILVEDNRNAFAVVGHFSRKAWHLKVGQRIRFTSAFFGQTAKTYRITDKEFGPGMSVMLSLKEDSSSIWDLADTGTLDDTPNTTLENPFTLVALFSVTLASGEEHLIISAAGDIQSRILVTWPLSSSGAVLANGAIEVQHQIVGSDNWQATATVSGSDTQTYVNNVQDGAFYFVRIRQRNLYLNVNSPWTYSTFQRVIGKTSPPNDVAGLTYTFEGYGIRANWRQVTNIDLSFYEVRIGGTSWATSTFVFKAKTTNHLLEAQLAGTRTLWVKAVDTTGNYSLNAASISITVLAPYAVVFKDVRVEQNKVNFEWGDAKSNQPILSYDYRVAKVVDGVAGTYVSRGGSGSNSRSDNIPFFEAATWRIGLTATDVAGNVGPTNTVDVLILLPDDYVPLLNTTSSGGGAMVNAVKTGAFNRVTLLLNSSETWQSHFASRGWNAPQDQINAGFPLYFQPGTTSASYTEDIDAGVVFAAGTIAVNISINTLAGTPVSSVQIGYKRLIGDAYTFGAAGARNLIAQNFRYIRIIVSATGTGADLAEIELLQTSINVQQIEENATVACLATDVNGTPYTATRGFTDIQGVTPGAVPQGSSITRVEARIVDADAPNTPAQVFIYLFNASSQRVSGNQFITINGV